MPQDWFSQFETKPTAKDDWFAQFEAKPAQAETVRQAQVRGFKEGAAQGASDLYAGTKEGLSGVVQMFRHPLDTATAMGQGIITAAEGVPDIARNLTHGDTAKATLRGFVRGGTEGATGVNSQDSFSRQIGQFIGGTVIPVLATAGTVKGVKLARAPRIAPLIVEANSGVELARAKPTKPIGLKLVEPAEGPQTSRVPYAAPEPAPVEKPARPNPNAGGRLVPQGGRSSAPPNANVAQAVREAVSELATTDAPAFERQAARAVPRIVRVVNEPPPELPKSWQPFADAGGKDAPPAVTRWKTLKASPPDEVGVAVEKPPIDVAELRAFRETYGADEAGQQFGLTGKEVRDLTGGPTRRPAKARLDELDEEYYRHLADERGAIDPAILRTLGLAVGGGVAGSLAADDHPLAGGALGALGGAALANPSKSLKALQELRMTGMLSGAALPKSLLGDIGAIGTAAIENGSLAPVKEALRLPTNAVNVAKGFVSGSHPGVGPVGKLNVFGRTMSGFDTATKQALERAGLPTSEAQRLLLQSPNAVGGRLGEAMRSPLGRAAVPFQNIPVNTVVEGINSLNELRPGSGGSNVRRALTVGAGAAGAASGDQTDNPLMLGLLAALAGPRAVPFALGAGMTAGPRVIERVGVGIPDASWKDLIDPLRPINNPALLRLLQQLQGQQP